MAASATAMPTMKFGARGAQPTAKSHEKLIANLKLTDKQAEPVRKILAAYRKDLAQWAAKNGPGITACQAHMKKYHQMRNPKVMAAIRAAMKMLSELGKEQVDMREAMLAKLKGAMTREQFAQAADALRPRPRPRGRGFQERFHHLGKMKLTKEQLTKITSITEEALKPPADGSPRKDNPMQLAWNRIVDKVLTKENHAELQNLMKKAGHRKMVLGILRGVKLTPEQSKKVNNLWNKAYEDAKKNPKSKFNIYRASRAQAMEKILTEAQRKQLQKMQENPHGGGMRTKTPMPIPMPPARAHVEDPKKKK